MPRGYDSNGNRIGGTSKRKPREFNFQREREEFDVTLLRKPYVMETLLMALKAGGALRFGLSRDKGAFALGIYDEGQPVTQYARSEEEFEALLRNVYMAFEDGSGE